MARYPLRSVIDGVALVTITAEDFAILTAGVEFDNERALVVARMHEDAAEAERVLVMRNRARRAFPLSPGERFRLEEPTRRYRTVEHPLVSPVPPAVQSPQAASEEIAARVDQVRQGDVAFANSAKAGRKAHARDVTVPNAGEEPHKA